MKIPLDLSEMMSNGKYEREIPLGLSEMMPNGKYELKIPLDMPKMMLNGKKNLENYISVFQVIFLFKGLGFMSSLSYLKL